MKQLSLNRDTVSIDQAIRDLKSQKALFSDNPDRIEIQSIKIPQTFSSNIYINVWRNHAFEPMQDLIRPYFSHRGASIEFIYSGYDSTLSFTGQSEADIELIWFDPTDLRNSFQGISFVNWFIDRIKSLRSSSYAPILVATWFETQNEVSFFQSELKRLTDAYFVDINRFCKSKALSTFDERTYALSGTRISKGACLYLAKEFGCKWLGGLVLPAVKAIAVDLDNTLHGGVLGEDGIHGVRLEPEHTKLQSHLKLLTEKGIFLALVSRNKKEDVEELFNQRKDFVLKWEDFSVAEVSWGSKSKAIENIAKALNIGLDSVLFVDDNVGELLEVKNIFPEVPQILASPDGKSTFNSIDCFPGLWRWKLNDADTKRIKDLKGNLRRSELSASALSDEEYLKSLKVKITVHIDDHSQLSRMSALSNKTNQFNLSFGRYSEAQILEKLKSQDHSVICVSLTDVVSDSGVIGLVIGKVLSNLIEIEEICISCRAMGRGIENHLILWAIRNIPRVNEVEAIAFNVVRGPRSEPAIIWISSLLNKNDIDIKCNERLKVSDLFSLNIPTVIKTEVRKNE